MGVDVAHRVQQFGHLALARGDDPGVGMAGGGDREGSGEVEIVAAVSVPDAHAFGPFPDDRPTAVRLDERDVARLVAAQIRDGFVGLFFHGSNTLLIGRPDELVHLQLVTHTQLVADDALDKFAPADRRMIGGKRVQRFVALMRLERGDP